MPRRQSIEHLTASFVSKHPEYFFGESQVFSFPDSLITFMFVSGYVSCWIPGQEGSWGPLSKPQDVFDMSEEEVCIMFLSGDHQLLIYF